MRTVRLVLGSIAVYLIVAACAATPGLLPTKENLDAGAIADALLDSIANPVGDAQADVNTSGSRLKARYYAGEDGSKQWIGWRDTQLAVDCSFITAADGETRCLPIWAGTSYVTPYTAFSDASCTVRVAYWVTANGPCTTTPSWATWQDAVNQCSTGSHVAKIDAPVTPSPAQLYAKQPNGSCVASSLTTGTPVYTLHAENAPTDFVRATVQVEP